MKPAREDPDKFRPERYEKQTFSQTDWKTFCQAAEDLDIPVDEEKKTTLENLYSHLVGVNSWMNLTKLTEPHDYLKFHILDSLTAYDVVDELASPHDLCMDLGSGGGYPGLPLMTWLPDRRWILVDSRRKKADFLREAIRLTPCRHAEAASFRGREARNARPDLVGKCALVTARAVGKADKILVEAVDLIKQNGFLLLLKGPAFAEEERRDLAECAEDEGFQFINEMTVALDEDNPERFLVLLRRKGRPKRRR